MEKTPTSSASKSEAPSPKKSNKKNESKGLKWFKGSPKSRSSFKLRLLKNAQKETTLTPIPIPPRVVEFELDGASERIGIFDNIPLIERDSSLDDLFNQSSDWMLQTPGTSSSLCPSTSKSAKKGLRGKGSSVKGNSVNSRTSCKKLFDKTQNHSLIEVPSWELLTPPVSDANFGHKQFISPLLPKLPEAQFRILDDYALDDAPSMPNSYIRYIERSGEDVENDVEYDLDEEDCAWLDIMNETRRAENLSDVDPENMEFLLDRLEKESYFQMQSTGVDHSPPIDDDAVCCICMDGECQNSNAILFCDMCNLAVHQECYGVPYIPEGQWLCRRCLQSPSRAVDCVLCPNKGGAFKQTDDSRWAHVVCAIWIPEVFFANSVFLEPIDSLDNIPAARWRLTCYICKQKGIGACIQCHKSNCYTAFHVTCAQQANLCMVMDTVREASSVTVKKTAWCDNHAPPESERTSVYCDYVNLIQKRKDKDDALSSPRQKMKQTRKLLAEKRDAIPIVSVPTIPPERMAALVTQVSFARKRAFLQRLMAYWLLKRQSRNGVPLLRRLQTSSSHHHPNPNEIRRPLDPSEMEDSVNFYKYSLRLRQDLERARLLCELVRKREKVKRLDILTKQRMCDLKLRPFNVVLSWIIDEIISRDVHQVFVEPVDTDDVTDYLSVISQPMDLSTMKTKANSYGYDTVDDLEADFNLMIDNCIKYNDKDTIFYRSAIRVREIGGMIIRQGRREIESIGYDPVSGMHLPQRPFVIQPLTDEQINHDVDSVLEDEARFDLPFEEHIKQLQNILDKSVGISHAQSRKRKFNKIRMEIIRVRRHRFAKNTDQSSFKQYKASVDARKQRKANTNASSDSDSDDYSSGNMIKRPPLTSTSQRKSEPKRRGRLSILPPPEKPKSSNQPEGRSLRPLKKTQYNLSPSPSPKKSVSLPTHPKKLKQSKITSFVQSKPPATSPRKSRRLSIVQTSTEKNTKNEESPTPGKRRPKMSHLSPLGSPERTPKPSTSMNSKVLSPVTQTPPGINRRTAVLFSNKKSPASNSKGTAKTSNKEHGARKNLMKPKKSGKSLVNIEASPTPQPFYPHPPLIFRDSNSTTNTPSANNSFIQWNSSLNKSPSPNHRVNNFHNSPPSRQLTSNCSTNTNSHKSPKSPTPKKRAQKTEGNDSRSFNNRKSAEPTKPKSDSFSVYRSGGDGLDSNSDFQDDEEENGVDSRPESRATSFSQSEPPSADELDQASGSEADSGSGSGTSSSDTDSSSSNPSEKPIKVKKKLNSPTRSLVRVQPPLRPPKEIGNGKIRKKRVKQPRAITPPRNPFPGPIGASLDDEVEEEEGLISSNYFNRNDFRPKLMDLVWSKCKDESWYPALIVNPEAPYGLTEHNVSIPGPPNEVLVRKPKLKEEVFLVLRFDNKRTWEWTAKSQLEPLGQDPSMDKEHLEARSHNDKKAVRKAYERAILHRCRASGTVGPNGECP